MQARDVEVAVVGSADICQCGSASVLRKAGYQVEETTDALTWASALPSDQPAVAVLLLAPGAQCASVARLRSARPSLAILVVLLMQAVPAAGRCAELLADGADAVLPGDFAGHTLVAAVACVLDGLAVLPRLGCRGLAVPVIPSQLTLNDALNDALSDAEVQWLRQLGDGGTVTRIAARSGLSERELHRRLHRIYERLGVSGRAQAVVEAGHRGLL